MKNKLKYIGLCIVFVSILILSCKDKIEYDYEALEKHQEETKYLMEKSIKELTTYYDVEYQWDTITYDKVDQYDKAINTKYQIVENARIQRIIENDSIIVRTVTGYMPWFCFDLRVKNNAEFEKLKQKSDGHIGKHFSLVIQIDSLFKGDYQIEKFQTDENGHSKEINPEDYHFYGSGNIIEVRTFDIMLNAPIITQH